MSIIIRFGLDRQHLCTHHHRLHGERREADRFRGRCPRTVKVTTVTMVSTNATNIDIVILFGVPFDDHNRSMFSQNALSLGRHRKFSLKMTLAEPQISPLPPPVYLLQTPIKHWKLIRTLTRIYKHGQSSKATTKNARAHKNTQKKATISSQWWGHMLSVPPLSPSD